MNKERRIGNFLLGQTIGVGSFGKVYLGQDIHTSETVALKITNRLKCGNRGIHEAELGKNLNHSSIARIYDCFNQGEWNCIVMEYIEGMDLFEKIETCKEGIPEHELKPIFHSLFEGMAYAHSNNIAHLDIKPENILLHKDIQAKIIDWGLGSFVDSDQKIEQYVGSLQYCPPEVLKKFPYDGKKADCWSFGVTLYVCLTGFFPWGGDTNRAVSEKILKGKFSWLSNTKISKEAEDLVSSLLKVNPSSRIDMQTALSHPWFSRENDTDGLICPLLFSP